MTLNDVNESLRKQQHNNKNKFWTHPAPEGALIWHSKGQDHMLIVYTSWHRSMSQSNKSHGKSHDQKFLYFKVNVGVPNWCSSG